MRSRVMRCLLVGTSVVGGSVAVASPAAAHSTACSAAHVVHFRPGQDVVRVVSAAGRGRTICFGAGTYRLTTPIRPRAGQILIGQDAVLDGSRLLTRFSRTPHGWVASGQTQQGERNGTCAGRSTACTYPDDVLRDGRPLRRVLSAAELRTGAYWFDYARNRIVLRDDPAGHRIEAMVASAAVEARSGAGGADVTVRGFTVEHFATRAQHGAIEAYAPGWLVMGNTVQRNHGAGITTGGHARVIGNTVLRNGQLGIGGSGAHILVRANIIAFNNTGGFDPGWEAGGAKWAVTDDLRVLDNNVHGNNGPGLWTDIDAQRTSYIGNVVRWNARAGIFHEISGAAVISHNTVVGNGHGYSSWLWGSGILLAGSHDVTVSANTLARNAEGIGLIQQDRGTSDVDGKPRTLHDIAIRDNTVTMSGADSGGVTDDGFYSMFTDPSITWTRNTWYGSRGAPFAWDDKEITAAQWRRLGHDVHGTFTG